MNKTTKKLNSPSYHFTKFQNKLYSEIYYYLQEGEGMNKSKLAAKLGVKESFVTHILHNGRDLRVSELIKLSLAIGKIPVVEFYDLEVDE